MCIQKDVTTAKWEHADTTHNFNHFHNHHCRAQTNKQTLLRYSAGQWGGTRAAHALRPVLSELGALPVSAMVHIPNAGDALDESGVSVVLGMSHTHPHHLSDTRVVAADAIDFEISVN
jgi:hypothetical protein